MEFPLRLISLFLYFFVEMKDLHPTAKIRKLTIKMQLLRKDVETRKYSSCFLIEQLRHRKYRWNELHHFVIQEYFLTRMHSSRMCTDRWSGCHSDVSSWGGSASREGGLPPEGGLPYPHPPDTRFWKHYIPLRSAIKVNELQICI